MPAKAMGPALLSPAAADDLDKYKRALEGAIGIFGKTITMAARAGDRRALRGLRDFATGTIDSALARLDAEENN